MLLGHTLFVFLSHEHQDTSAMSVLHSLILQLARKDPKLMDMVRYTDRDVLEFDLSSAVKLFTNLVQGAGPVRIIIDGLDEIEETERVVLLRQMLTLSNDCDEARVLIASRPEADITSLLEKPSKSIRVDAQNTPSIHAFVMSRFDNWLQGHSLSPEDETEIRGLMGGLAGQAKGNGQRVLGAWGSFLLSQHTLVPGEYIYSLLTRNVPLRSSHLKRSRLPPLCR